MKLLNEKETPVIRSATTYVLEGKFSEDDIARIKDYCINPVDSRETDEKKPDTLVQNFEEPADVAIFEGFKDMSEDKLKELYDSLNLAMTFKDFLHIQNYFAERRKKRSIRYRNSCTGYVLVRSLPSYNIFNRIKECYI